MRNGTSRVRAALLALGLAFLTGAAAEAAPPEAALAPPGAERPRPLQPVHDTLGEAVPDEKAAANLAHHMIEDLVAEHKIDAAWREAAPIKAERKRLSRRSPFEVWVVHFLADGDVAGKGSDLYIMVSGEGEFLKYSYQAP